MCNVCTIVRSSITTYSGGEVVEEALVDVITVSPVATEGEEEDTAEGAMVEGATVEGEDMEVVDITMVAPPTGGATNKKRERCKIYTSELYPNLNIKFYWNII